MSILSAFKNSSEYTVSNTATSILSIFFSKYFTDNKDQFLFRKLFDKLFASYPIYSHKTFIKFYLP